VKKLAKLTLFFSLCFIIFLAAITCARFLSLRVDWARTLPQKPEAVLTTLITAAHWALALTLYSSILLSLSYAARGRYNFFMSVVCINVLAILCLTASSLMLRRWESIPSEKIEAMPLGGKGLILSNALNRNETAIILLDGSTEGPRVVAVPDNPLAFQEGKYSEGIILPPVPFGDNTPWFIKSIAVDIKLTGEHLRQCMDNGIINFLIYSSALICLLTSLGFTLNFSVWPLANLFLGALIFRAIVALETFLLLPETQEIIKSIINIKIPPYLTVPLIFYCFSLLIFIYQILVFAAKKRSEADNDQ
jgi:hypothetical protein